MTTPICCSKEVDNFLFFSLSTHQTPTLKKESDENNGFFRGSYIVELDD